MDALADHLTPQRRKKDRNEPECSPTELRALAALGRSGTLIMRDLAAILKVPLSTATHTVDKLVAKGLVERRRITEDRRVVQIGFSKRGQKINQYVVDARLAAARRMIEPLTAVDRADFLRQIAKLNGREH